MNLMTSEMTKSSVFVLGMHRSGTSMVAGLLSLLGLDLPKTLLPANEENPKGYFESPVFMDLNDRLLAALDSSWADWRMIEPRALADLQMSEAVEQVRGAVSAEFSSARMAIIKDPRICRLLPIWRTALGDLNFSSSAIIPYRSPAEVARSLNLRDGLTIAKGQMVWLRHSLDAELASRDMPRSFVPMPELIANPQGVLAQIAKDIGIEWPIPINDAKKKISNFVDTKLHRQKISRSGLGAAETVSSWVWAAYDAFEVLKKKPRDLNAQKSLDEIRLAFDESQRLFAPIVEETRFAAETRKKVEADLETAKKEIDRLEQLLKSTGSDIEGLVVDLDFKKNEISILRAQTETLERQSAELEKLKVESERLLGLEAELARTQRDKIESNFALYSEQAMALAASSVALLGVLPGSEGHDPRLDVSNLDLNGLSVFECHDLAVRTIAAAMVELRDHAAERASLAAMLGNEKEVASALKAELDDITARYHEVTQSLAAAREAEEASASSNRLLIAEKQVVLEANAALDSMLNAEREILSALRAEADVATTRIGEAMEALASAREENAAVAAKYREATGSLDSALQVNKIQAEQLTKFESEFASLRMSLEHAHNQIDALSASRDAVQRDYDDALSLISDLNRSIEDRDKTQRAADEAIELAHRQIAQQDARHRELQAANQTMAVLLVELKQQRRSLTERNRASERKIERVRTMLETKIGGMAERHAAELASLMEKLSAEQQRSEALDSQYADMLAAHARERLSLQERIDAAQRDAIVAERRGLEAVSIIEARFTALTAEREDEFRLRLDDEMVRLEAERAEMRRDYEQQVNTLAEAREQMNRDNKRLEDEYYAVRLRLMLSEQDVATYRAPLMRRITKRFIGKPRGPKLI